MGPKRSPQFPYKKDSEEDVRQNEVRYCLACLTMEAASVRVGLLEKSGKHSLPETPVTTQVLKTSCSRPFKLISDF